MYFCKHSGRR